MASLESHPVIPSHIYSHLVCTTLSIWNTFQTFTPSQSLPKISPSGASGKEPACQCRRHEMWVWSLCREDPLEEGMAAHSSILAWRISIDKGAWWVTVHRVAKSQTWLKQLSTQALPSKLCLNIQVPDQGITCYFHSKFPWQVNEFIYLLKSFWWCQEMF